MLWVFCVANFAHTDDENSKLYIYNWSEYISSQSLNEFEKKEGITVIYDVFDSEEMLDAKLISGDTGYDLVFPASSQFLASQINAKLYQPIDKSKLKNYKNIEPILLQKLSYYDAGNKYTVPFMWTVTGIGYDINKIKSIDEHAPINSLHLIFNPQYAEKFSKCGIAWFNSPTEMIGLALIYNGYDPNDINEEKLEIAKTTLENASKYVKYILSGDSTVNYPEMLANGSVCVAVGWLGDIAQTKEMMKTPENPLDNIQYNLPKEGFFLAIDAMAIPKNSHKAQDVYKLIDFLLEPQVAAVNSNYTRHMTVTNNSKAFLDKQLIKDPNLNLSQINIKKAYTHKAQPIEILRKKNRLWNNIVTGTK